MNELIIVAVLFVPVALIILFAYYSQKKIRKKQQRLMLEHLQFTYPALSSARKELTWQRQQLIAIFPDAGRLIHVSMEGPLIDSVEIPLNQVSGVTTYQETETMKQEGKNSRMDAVIVKSGLMISYDKRQEQLCFFDYNKDHSSSLPEKQAHAERFRIYLNELIATTIKTSK